MESFLLIDLVNGPADGSSFDESSDDSYEHLTVQSVDSSSVYHYSSTETNEDSLTTSGSSQCSSDNTSTSNCVVSLLDKLKCPCPAERDKLKRINHLLVVSEGVVAT